MASSQYTHNMADGPPRSSHIKGTPTSGSRGGGGGRMTVPNPNYLLKHTADAVAVAAAVDQFALVSVVVLVMECSPVHLLVPLSE